MSHQEVNYAPSIMDSFLELSIPVTGPWNWPAILSEGYTLIGCMTGYYPEDIEEKTKELGRYLTEYLRNMDGARQSFQNWNERSKLAAPENEDEHYETNWNERSKLAAPEDEDKHYETNTPPTFESDDSATTPEDSEDDDDDDDDDEDQCSYFWHEIPVHEEGSYSIIFSVFV